MEIDDVFVQRTVIDVGLNGDLMMHGLHVPLNKYSKRKRTPSKKKPFLLL